MSELVIQTILITLVAFVGYMHSYWGSLMINRPIIVAPLVGLILGDITTGIMIGGTLELIFLGAVPIGASNPPDFTSGAIISTAFVILSGAEIGVAVALAVPVATLILLFDNLQMMFLLAWATHIADGYAAKGDYKKVELVARVAGIGNKVILSLIVGLSFYFGISVIDQVLAVIPEFIISGMDVAAGMLPAIGFAMIARMILSKDLAPYLLAGFLLAAYLNIPTLGVTLIGLVIASLIYFNTKTKEVVADANEF
jgi:fructoselysine and glucoselysine-specific PTS system IIC component